MWHTLNFVADSRHIDAEKLNMFAMANQDKYAIAADRSQPEVNTWHVDQLVKDFKALPVVVTGGNREDLLQYASARRHQ